MSNSRRSSGPRTGVTSRMRSAAATAAAKAIDSHVRVAVRCRPMSSRETNDGHQPIVEFEQGRKVIVNNAAESPSDQLGTRSGERSNLVQVYEFDAVFDWTSSQETVYNSVCKPIVDSVLEGYNGTIFAYGQTGTGKTYTMEGPSTSRRPSASRRASDITPVGSSRQSVSAKKLQPASARLPTDQPKKQSAAAAAATGDSAGVIPRAFKHIFDHVASRKSVQFLVRASYMEIYQEEIHDLLRKDRTKLKLHERPDTGVYVKDLTSYVCKSIEEIERVMRVGNQNRKVGATDMNEHSSRSHAIFIITIEQQQQQTAISAINQQTTNNKQQQQQQQQQQQVKNLIRVGRLNLVDLAGSERQRKTNNSGQRHKESIKINLSLSALGNVINSLMKMNEQQQSNKNPSLATAATATAATNDTSFHVPYRDSKLTRLLQDSLGGNSRTLMIANIGPASYNYDETINTLNYASRAKCIQNRPRLNEDPKDALLRQLQDEIQELRARLISMAAEHPELRERSGVSSKPQTGGEGGGGVELELIELREKLASLESKLLNGATTSGGLDHRLLEGYTRQQVDELERNKAQLLEQASRETRIRTELEKREEAELEIKQSYSSVQQEVDAKRALIRQVLLKTKGLHNDLEAAQNTYRLELDELDQLQYVLQKELRLKCLIMDNFIPNQHVEQLLPRISYNEKRDTCSVEPIDLPLDYCNLDHASSIKYTDVWQDRSIRPRSELERISETINPNDARYKWDNVLDLRVEQPNLGEPPKRLSKSVNNETNQPQPQSKIQSLIEAALNEHEPDIVI